VVAPTLALTLALAPPAAASPPACLRDDAAMVAASDAVVTAEVLSVTASRTGTMRRLQARYRVTERLKGRLGPGQRITVVASCLDEPVPASMQGYPVVERYCRGGIAPVLTGVETAGARPRSPVPAGGWPLFLAAHGGDTTWSEVSRTSYSGACTVEDGTLSAQDRHGIERLRQRGNAGTP
jgi:hypothetical protein